MLISKFPIKTELPKCKFKLSNIVKFLRLYPELAGISENFRKEKSVQNEISNPCQASRLSLKLFNYYLKTYKEQLPKRIRLAKYFQNKLKNLGFATQNDKSNNFTYLSALVPENIKRDELFEKLRNYGIFCSRIWQKPIYPELPNTNKVAERIINFPLQSWYTEKDIDKIIKNLQSILLKAK